MCANKRTLTQLKIITLTEYQNVIKVFCSIKCKYKQKGLSTWKIEQFSLVPFYYNTMFRVVHI